MNNLLVTNATVYPMEGDPVPNGYVLVEDGHIQAYGAMEQVPTCGADWKGEILNAHGGFLMPGLVDAHSHIGLYEDSLGFEGADGNEDTDPVTPHLRVVDGINPMDYAFTEARAAGVTTVVVSPGSANPIGGQIAAIKTTGRRIDDMVIRAPVAIKLALGENPKSAYHDKDETPVTRMATAGILREQLAKAKEYAENKRHAVMDEEVDPPDFDAKLEALLPLIHGEIPAHIHAHRADDIFTGLRIAKEFGVRAVLIHGTEAHLVADLIAEDGVPVVSGPYMTDRSKPELSHMDEAAPGILARAGVPIAITTDHPEFPVKYLLHAALIAVQHGMDEHAALRAITLGGAQIAGIDDRVGSIRVGKDGDLVLYTGYPFDYKSQVAAVFCEGKCIYRRKQA